MRHGTMEEQEKSRGTGLNGQKETHMRDALTMQHLDDDLEIILADFGGTP